MNKYECEYPRIVSIDQITEENFEQISENYHCEIGEWILQFEIDSDGREPEGGAVIWKRKPTDAEIRKIAKGLE